MHVLYFHQHFSTPEGATGTRSYEMARRLIERGHRVTMVCGSYGLAKTGLQNEPVDGTRSGKVDGIDVVEISVPYSNYDSFAKRSTVFLKFAMKSIGIARRAQYDLLFATSTPLTAGLPGIAMKLLKRRKPFVFEVRDLWPELPRAMGVIRNPVVLALMSFLEWLSYRCADACVGLAPGIKDGITRRSRPGKRVEMIPNGCDLDLFTPKPSGSRSSSELKAVFMGAHGIANGLDKVLDAARVLKKRQRRDIRIVFVGDGRLKPEMRKRAKEEQLDNCTFMEPIPKPELARLMHDVDVGLMVLANVPAFYNGTSPNKFFDYIASGLPVLNNYPGWLSDVIMKHKCGIAVSPDNADAFADALEFMSDHPDEVRTMGGNARNLAEKQFGRRALADKFVDLLETVHQSSLR
jgi:glycosyltransferase involved in cell wall biosynthesis